MLGVCLHVFKMAPWWCNQEEQVRPTRHTTAGLGVVSIGKKREISRGLIASPSGRPSPLFLFLLPLPPSTMADHDDYGGDHDEDNNNDNYEDGNEIVSDPEDYAEAVEDEEATAVAGDGAALDEEMGEYDDGACMWLVGCIPSTLSDASFLKPSDTHLLLPQTTSCPSTAPVNANPALPLSLRPCLPPNAPRRHS